MSEETKHILRIFVSHQDLNKYPGLRDACRILEEEKNKINHEGLQKDLIEVRLEDYQFWRNLSNPNNSTYQSANSLKEEAANAHAVFTLVEGDISPRIKKWYTEQIRKIRKAPDNRRVHLPIFWDTSNPESAANCESFYKRNDSDLVFRFNSLDEFRTHAASELKQLTDRWATLISRKQPVPTLASNSLRRKVRWFISGLVFALLCLAAYLLWPPIQSLCVTDNVNEPEITNEEARVDSTHAGEQAVIPGAPELAKSPQKKNEAPSLVSTPATEESLWTDEQKQDNRLVYISISAKTLSGEHKGLKGRVKNKLSEVGLKVTDIKGHALWTIAIDCEAREHTETSGFYTAFVDIDLDINNTVTGECPHSGSISLPGTDRDGIKGVSTLSYDKAVEKAYQNAYPLIDNYILQMK